MLGVMTVWLSTLGVAHAQTTNVWTDSFERADPTDQWSVDNGIWEFGNPATGPATNSAGYRTHEGTNCAATVLAGNYPGSTSSRLIRTLPFVVPAANQNPRLQFWHWYAFSGNSYGVVQIKYGTNNWADLSPRYYATGSGVWTRPVVDLSAFGGKAVQIAFQINADGNVADGWDVDRVSVIKGLYTVGFTNGATESFESGLGDWYAETGTWEVGVPTYGPPTNVIGSRAHSGTNCIATVLGDYYEDDRSSRLISPSFVVPSAAQLPRLRFWEWFSIGGHDFMEVQIKVGTNAWQALSDQISLDSFDRWTRAWLDLTSFAGQTVQLGFYFESHGYTVHGYDWFLDPGPGWYVDDVVIEIGPTPPLALPEGFENGWGGWRVDYIGGQVTDFGIWEIGQPTSGPGAAHAGTNCAATVLNGNYPDDRSARLISPPFDVPSAAQLPRLRFWEWFSIGGHDFMEVQIKVGTNAWQALSDQISLDSFDRWTRAWLDLTSFAGQTVQLGFYFESHGYTVHGYDWFLDPGPGWYVDDVVIEIGPTPPLALPEGFENGWGGWRVDYIGGQVTDFGIWEIGQPTSGPGAAHAGTNCAATVLNGNYPDDRSARLISPPFVVPQLGAHPTLRFWHWFSIGGHDFCDLQIKPAGGAWQTLMRYTGDSAVWSRPGFDLSQYAGQTVQLGFYFESHGYTVHGYDWFLDPGPGWYVDDVQITSVTPPTGIVQFTDVRYFVNEGETTATISMERKYGGAGAVDVTFVATDGTGVGGVDFDSVVDTISWADGEQGVKTDIVPIHQNCAVRGNKTVTLQLLVPGSVASSVAREDATLVIVDNCLPSLSTGTNIAYLRALVGTPDYVPTNTTTLVTVDGTVTTYTNLSTSPTDEMFVMQDDTSGIAVWFRNGTNQFLPQAGDRVRVTAALTTINGLLALAPDYNNLTNVVWRLSANNSLPTPGALDFAAQTNVTAMEATEARYVSAAQVWIDQTGGSTLPSGLTDLIMTNQSGQTFSLTIHPTTDLAGKPKPAGPVTILGVLTQNDPTTPYTTNYSLLPTRYADIITAPTIAGQPLSRTNGVGTTASFTVTAVGSDPLYYQWRRGGTNLLNLGNVSGTTSNVLTLANVQLADATNYTVVVTNYLGTVTSSNATLTVVVPVTLTTQPVSQTVDAGTDVTFTVGATGSLPFTYQWWWNGAPISGATSALLVRSAVPTNWAGNYSAVVNNAANLPATSTNAVLTVIQVPIGISVPVGAGYGSYTKSNNTFTVIGGGEDIEGTDDRFFFVYLPWTGDGEIMANLKSLAPVDLHSEAGLMFRDGVAVGARHVFLAMDAGNEKVLRRRLAENAYSVENRSQGTNNVWLKLMRMGDTFSGHYSTNGVNWELVWWTTQPNLPTTLDVGLAVTAHLNGSFATAVFDMVGPRGLTPLDGARPHVLQLGGELGGMSEFQRVGGFKLLLDGAVGAAYNIKVSPTANAPFASWPVLTTVTNTYGVVPVVDAQALTNGHRLYRGQKVGP